MTWRYALKCCLALLVVCLLAATSYAAEVPKRPRSWQPIHGNDVEATLVKEPDGEVVLRDSEGRLLKFGKDELGTDDLRYLQNVREAVHPFRTWHLDNLPEIMADTPREVVASYVGVRGFDARFSEAVVILIRDDYRRRSYPLKAFSKEDQDYVAQMQAAEEPKKHDSAVYESRWTEYDPVKDHDTVNVSETEHFMFFYGNDRNGSGKAFFEEPDFLDRSRKYFEQMWDFYQNLGVTVPYANAEQKYKIPVYVTGTGLPQHKEGWAFAAEAIILHPGAMGPGSSVVPHEFSHCLQFHLGGFRNSAYVGWFWECHANWSGEQFMPGYPAALDGYADRAHYELSSTRMNYGSWPFLQYISEDPRFPPMFCYRIWEVNRKNEKGESVEDPFQTIMRFGSEQGVSHGDGTQDFGNLIGEVAAHDVSWDYVHQYFYQRAMRNHLRSGPAARNRVVLQPVPDRPGWYRPIYSHAPRQYGINIIDLVRDPGADEVQVDFRGIVDETEGSDWRLTLVAIDDQGEARYSRMWRGGKGVMGLQPNEQRLALAIAATPKVYKPLEFRPGFNKKRRYPYEVSFKGCTPAAMPPLPALPAVEGALHPNGLGFVASTATVAPTAFLGPNAKVLDRAHVSGNARIEDYAVVMGDAQVSGNAVVSGYARIRDRAKITDNARVGDCALVAGDVEVKENARILEYAHVLDRGIVRGDVLIKGFGEVHMQPSTDLAGGLVCGEDLEVWLADYKKRVIEGGLIYGYNNAEILEKELADNRYLYAHWTFDEPRRYVLKDAFADNDGVLRGEPPFGREDGRTVLTFNGFNQYALVEGHLADTVDMTIDMQVRWEGGSPNQCLFDLGSRTSRMFFTPSDNDGVAAFVIRKGRTVQTVRAEGPFPVGKWTRVTIILDRDEGRLYFDGQEVGRNPAMTLNPEDLRATAGFIGRRFAGGGCFNGALDDLAIYRKAFTSIADIPGS